MTIVKNFQLTEEKMGKSIKISMKIGSFLLIAIRRDNTVDVCLFDGDGLIFRKEDMVTSGDNLIQELRRLAANWMKIYMDNFIEEEEVYEEEIVIGHAAEARRRGRQREFDNSLKGKIINKLYIFFKGKKKEVL